MFFLLLLLLLAGTAYVVAKRYNALQLLAHEVREAHANVMASMKKRVDLVNRLIDIAKGYADHEKLTHLSVATAGDEISFGGMGVAAAGAMNQVLKLATQYPDLKANATFQQLMAQLDDIETNLQFKREAYNGSVKLYNSAISTLPVSLYARQLGFRPAPYFDVDSADALENLKDFHSQDSEHLRQLLADGSRRLADGGRKLAGESVRIGRIAVEKGMELQARHATPAVEEPVAAPVGPVAPAAAPPPPEGEGSDAGGRP
jgi:LemA protein